MNGAPEPGASPEGKRLCWKCGTWHGPDVVVCVNCGLNLETGREIQSGADEEREGRTAFQRLLMFIADWMPGLFRPALTVASIVLALAGLGVIWFSVLIFFMGAVLSAAPMGGVGLIMYAQAVAWMLAGRLELLHDVLADLEGKKWSLFLALVFAPFAVALVLLKLGAPA